MKLWSALLREESFPLCCRLHPAHHPFQTEVQSYQPGRDHRWRAPGRCDHSRRNGSLFSAAAPVMRSQSEGGASSGPLHARGVFPLTLVYHQDVHAASDMRAAPVMRSQSEGQKLWSASRARSLFPLIHSLPNRDVQAAPKMSSIFPLIHSLPSGCASRTKDEQSIDFHHPGCVRRIGFASYILNVCSIRVHKPGCVRRIGDASYILVVYALHA